MAVVVAVDVKVGRKEGKTRAEMRIDRAAANIAEPCLAAFYTWSRCQCTPATPGLKVARL